MAVTPVTRRRAALEALSQDTFDLLVVGGGITGAGIARDAALRGFRVALIEKDDFGSGTSSKSSKLIHGGLRYLEQAELKLVFESVNERKRLMRLARHVVRPLPFLVTNYQGDRRWLATLDLGLWVYDALCAFGSYRNHRTHFAAGALALEPGLRREGLNGGVLYYDALTDDARLTLENVIDAAALGATVLNHARARDIHLDAAGRVTGLDVIDEETGDAVRVTSKLVINASGPWSDQVRALLGERPILKPTKGVHVVVDKVRLPIQHALMLTSPRDKRVVFAIPWAWGRTVIGTTDTFFDGSPDRVDPEASDVDYLLATANSYFPLARLTPDDVLATWSGLRPLLKPHDDGAGASEVSREHVILQRPGFITIAGGKLTTYRRMAQEVVDRATEQLGVTAESSTDDRPIPGAVGLVESDDALITLATELGGGPRGTYLAETYGSRSRQIIARVKHDPTAAQPLDAELPAIMAQVDEAMETEFATTLDDMLSRRIPVALRGRDQGLAIAPVVAARMAHRLEWSAARTEKELSRYREVVTASRAFRANG